MHLKKEDVNTTTISLDSLSLTSGHRWKCLIIAILINSAFLFLKILSCQFNVWVASRNSLSQPNSKISLYIVGCDENLFIAEEMIKMLREEIYI